MCVAPLVVRYLLASKLTSRARPAVLGVNFGQSYASIAVIDKEGHPQCIANEEGERQIACAISYAGEQVVSSARFPGTSTVD